MKIILLSACVITLLTTTGCIVAEEERHGHGSYRGPAEVIVAAPVVVVPVVRVRDE
jgi:hypothetical protein